MSESTMFYTDTLHNNQECTKHGLINKIYNELHTGIMHKKIATEQEQRIAIKWFNERVERGLYKVSEKNTIDSGPFFIE